MSYLEQIGNKIRQKRLELGMTQDELAKKAGYSSRSSINKLELGCVDPSVSRIYAIAEALNIPPMELAFPDQELFELNINEKKILESYRNVSELRLMMDQLLDDHRNHRIYYTAAHSQDGIADAYVVLDAEIEERLRTAPETDDPLL